MWKGGGDEGGDRGGSLDRENNHANFIIERLNQVAPDPEVETRGTNI